MKNNPKILVVDDDANLRKTLADILRIKGYAVTAAANGAEAIAEAQRAAVNVALIDLMLPDMSGIEVMEQIKTGSPHTEAIILTGHASLTTAIEATAKGAFSYLLKPYEIEDLLLHIHHALDRQQAQEEIRRLASFPRLNPQPVIEITASCEVTYANPAADKLFPDLRSLDGQHPLLIGLGNICADFRQCGQAAMVREVAIGAASYEEHLYCVPESELIRINVMDITDRKHKEQSLRESEERFRKITESAQDAIIMMGGDQRISFWNAAAERIFGYTAAEATGQELHILIASASTRAGFAQAFPHFHETGEGPIIGKVRELTALRKGGEEFQVELSVSATQFGGQWIAIGIVRDITERKAAEDKLAESESHFRSLFENMLNGFAYCRMLYDDDGHPVDFVYIDVNAAFERITGLKNVRGRPVSEVIPGIRELSPELFETYASVASSGIPKTFEFDFKSQSQWYYISVYSQEKEHFVAVFDDITERKQTEAKLAEQLEELRRWHDVTSGREGRILELKHEVNEILGKVGKPPRYPSAESPDPSQNPTGVS